MGTRVLEALTNNKLVAGLVLLALTLTFNGMRADAANEYRLQAVEEKVKTLDALNEFKVRYEEREKRRDEQTEQIKAQIIKMDTKLDEVHRAVLRGQ
jgi:TPP-dependent pyruvate/acetoin dehydrogenase alpha subunit